MAAAISGLAAISRPDARLLILGSMPGAKSLQQQQYYAHPRNAFWPVMTRLLGLEPGLSYPGRLQALLTRQVALWDVLGCCQRQGSLDSAITAEQANDFTDFMQHHSQIIAIAFNGAKAWQSFQRHVIKKQQLPATLQLIPLPSTSPAHARQSLAEKLERWSEITRYIPC
ncbi:MULTISPECIES: DNA-deoxyinosine glycosylase [unclassified Arsukibacterium]|uniref:DNA-deoxyinosine glycosylase n=1 Tax=unclassified Arsukibacterium TaxID=2635278 RepID=UPI000C557445|nr:MULTISPECIES: DNA-deoxyinosine glycosylase [unclassified Arsukibacterium]MAA93456.1 DNA-deoxyinosine glycosylase [Rheinheimera sp.]MBM34790.1 DNA-deoxyinosine glycosylase [Rheinheimera sp.]|tara:strand:- start:2772 stop:3281 length:510 start_codon:yes stop_codon:yes gene_type:complete